MLLRGPEITSPKTSDDQTGGANLLHSPWNILELTCMEVENHLLVVENGLPKGHSPLPC